MKEGTENWQTGPCLTTTKTRATPYLLRLSWNGKPMHYNDKLGWGFLIEKVEYEQIDKSKPKKRKAIKLRLIVKRMLKMRLKMRLFRFK